MVEEKTFSNCFRVIRLFEVLKGQRKEKRKKDRTSLWLDFTQEERTKRSSAFSRIKEADMVDIRA